MDNTPASKLIRNIFFSFAEFERDMIVERTLEGKQIKMETDVDATLGRPKKFKKAQRDTALQLLEDYSYNEVAKRTGISRRTLIRYKKENDLKLLKTECEGKQKTKKKILSIYEKKSYNIKRQQNKEKSLKFYSHIEVLATLKYD